MCPEDPCGQGMDSKIETGDQNDPLAYSESDVDNTTKMFGYFLPRENIAHGTSHITLRHQVTQIPDSAKHTRFINRKRNGPDSTLDGLLMPTQNTPRHGHPRKPRAGDRNGPDSTLDGLPTPTQNAPRHGHPRRPRAGERASPKLSRQPMDPEFDRPLRGMGQYGDSKSLDFFC
ncbi:hypothetical protein HOY80DRAFT_1085552 [Tuber brumale]|nr:hypothetical protein HOY80DRAFT_1085552 [Tuber brumale]